MSQEGGEQPYMHQSTSITLKRPTRSSSLLAFPTPLAQPETMLWAQTAVPVAQHNDLHITHNSCPTSTVFSAWYFFYFPFSFFPSSQNCLLSTQYRHQSRLRILFRMQLLRVVLSTTPICMFCKGYQRHTLPMNAIR